jgi:hypothetical protein
MIRPEWQQFEGTNYEVGRQLGMYWCARLSDFKRTKEGRRIVGLLKNSRPLPEQPRLERAFKYQFPDLAEELKGVLQGVHDAGFTTASYQGVFRLALGEVDDEVEEDCSSIAHCGRRGNFLAHNEEECSIVPLCYARVKLRGKRTLRKFLSASYPFQLFGTAVGANTKIAFTGNSIGIQDARWQDVKRSRTRRVPKAVLTRCMLECQSIGAVKRLLCGHYSMLPSHWYVASASKIVSIQMRPSNDIAVKQRTAQIEPSNILRSACHTNHFQCGETDSWLWEDHEDQDDSERRLKLLNGIVRKVATTSEADAEGLERRMKAFRKRAKTVDSTLATIVLKVRKNGVEMRAFDYFAGASVGTARI